MVGSILTAETGHDHRKGVVESEHLVREKTEGHYFALEAVEMRALLAALEARDGYTGEHSKTVMGLAVEVACRMRLPRGGTPRRRGRSPPARHRKGMYP